MSELKGACIIGQSGGPTSVINASAYGVIRTALDSDCITAVYGAEHGIKGVLADRLFDMSKEDARELELLKYTPSSALGSCRYKIADPDVDDTDYKRILEVFKKHDVRYFFYNGGNDSMDTCNKISKYMQKVGYECRVMGVPKTIDNDVPFVTRTFGFVTAVDEASKAVVCAHTEAHSVLNGISLVKIMGRHAGFIAAGATIASQDVNFTLVPEVPFELDGPDGLLEALKKRVLSRAHAVILVAEGAGQHLLEGDEKHDASGNVKLKDIGVFLRDRIETYFKAEKIPFALRYFDPSYMIRSVPACAEDAVLCDFYARNAVHAAMAGKTGLVIGQNHGVFTHVPIDLLTTQKKQLDLNSPAWQGVLASTGQSFGASAN